MIEEEEEEQEEGEEEEEEEHINIEEENNTTINTNINRKKSKSRRRYVHFGKDVIDPEKEALRIKKLIYKVKVGTRIISFVAILALTQEIINRTLFNGKNEHLYNGLITCFVIGMLLTPPDVISQTLLAIPTWLLFELGLFLSRFIKK